MNKAAHLESEVEVNVDVAKDLGLTAGEYEKIVEILGRVPTYTELGVYSVMWSEHCSYKNSILQLKTLPRSGGRMLVEAGEENAGLIDVGGGYAIAFKIESHNHPSAVEPYQGAATGVGGILRDIFTMGARPIAALNSLRFGSPSHPRTSYLVRGVVKGIGDYGNSFGVPTVAGEVYFEECYNDNPLVNAMAVGIVATDKTATATAEGIGNPVFIMGSRTGRDGIHGASLLASREFDEKTEDMRPTVQVGDPFAEKVLLEATLELIASGAVVGIQDMGAAGISCSSAEMSAKGEVGMDIDLDLVPLREEGMSAYEIMLSESQERMLVVVEKGKEAIALAVCEKWEVPFTQIGTVNDSGTISLKRHGRTVAALPAESLVLGGGAPVYEREWREAAYIEKARSFDLGSLQHPSAQEAFEKLLASPSIASKRWVYEQYDSQVGTNTVRRAEADAAVLRLKELPGKGIAVTTDCNSRYVYLNPYKGGLIAVCEAARNVACTGAEPVAITNCLNFGNPYNPEVYWQFREAIRGMGDACRALNTPVTGGNVSFHNESQKSAVFPTPTIGMLGLIDDISATAGSGFRQSGDTIFLLGEEKEELGGSEYLKIVHNVIAGDTPDIDLQAEIALQQLLRKGIAAGVIGSAHDCAEGGLAIALAECVIHAPEGVGAACSLGEYTSIAHLFGETQSRVVVSCAADKEEELLALAAAAGVPCRNIGRTTASDTFGIEGRISCTRQELHNLFFGGLTSSIGIEA